MIDRAICVFLLHVVQVLPGQVPPPPLPPPPSVTESVREFPRDDTDALGERWREAWLDPTPTRAYLREPSRWQTLARTPDGLAWLVLAHLAAGSTMRAGTDRELIKLCVRTLREAQADDGRFPGFDPDPSRQTHLLVALALEEASRRSHYQLLRPHVCMAAAAAAAWAFESPALSPEEFALLAVLTGRIAGQPTYATEAEACREAAERARQGLQFGRSRRGDAALHLGDLALGARADPALTVARCWPANTLADPLHTWFGALALQHTDEPTWRRETASLAKLLAVRTTDGADAGGWPAAAGEDPVWATAILATALGTAAEATFVGDSDQATSGSR